MQISRHEETEAHIYGYCTCPDKSRINAADIAAGIHADAKADAEIDVHDGLPAESPHCPATRKLSSDEIARRRAARRRF